MIKAIKIVPILSLLPVLLLAQEKVDTAMMQRIRQEEMQGSQLPQLAHQLMEVCGPRLTNSPGFIRAVEWTVSQMQKWGLSAGAERWDSSFGRGWTTERTYVAIKVPYYQPLIAYPKAWSKGTNGNIQAPLVLLPKLDSATILAMGGRLSGKIVLLESAGTLPVAFDPKEGRLSAAQLDQLPDAYMEPSNASPAALAREARQIALYQLLEKEGAVAVLSMGRKSRDGTVFVMGTAGYKTIYNKPMPQLVVATEHYLQLQRLLTGGTPVTLEIDLQNNWHEDNLNGQNVIGEISGADPLLKKELVMLGGHLDSWHSGTGATDNGAGCIVMMEAIRILKKLGVRPRRTIRIALWGGEEQGELGSSNYIKQHFGQKVEQAKVSAYFNLDNGTGKIRGVYLQNNSSAGPVFKNWLIPFADLGATGIANSNTGATDHIEFERVGIPAFQFIQDPLDYEQRTHHSNMDVYDHLSFDELRQAAVIVAAFVYNAAMRDEILPRK